MAGPQGTDPENSGTTQKRGKGLDVLFGGSSGEERTGASEAGSSESNVTEEQPDAEEAISADDLGGLDDATLTPPPAPKIAVASPDESLPVNEADTEEGDVTSSDEFVDDLGLPVAMEAPPPDLEPAALAPAAPEPIATSAPPTPMVDTLPMDEADTDDLSGLVAEDDLSDLAAEDDLSDLTVEEDSPGLSDRGEEDLSGLSDTMDETETIPPANLPPSPPPATAAPDVVPSTPTPPSPVSPTTVPPSTTFTPPVSPTPTASTSPPPSTLGTPPSTATGAPNLSIPRSRIDSFSGIVTERMQVAERDILPEDTKYTVDVSDNVLAVRQRSKVEADEIITRNVTRYVGRERRERLDQEIERLYDEVAYELSSNKADAESALDILSQAQNIVFEDTREYDEALYRVAVVKTMLARKRNLRRWTYTWGAFTFFYVLIWLFAFVSGFLLQGQLSDAIGPTNEMVDAVRAAWFSALAGGIGGCIGVLFSLYWHVGTVQDFTPQKYVMYYLVQPVMGFFLGAVVYFIIGAGFLLVNFAVETDTSSGQVLASPTVIAIQVVMGWIAGFRQRFVFEMIDKIVQRLSPKEESNEDKAEPDSFASTRRLQRSQPAFEIETPPGERQIVPPSS